MKANDESWNFDIKKMLLLRECIKGFPPKNNVIFVVIWLFVSCLSDFYGYGMKLGFHGATSTQLPSLDISPNGQFFYSKYVRQSRPVLFKGAASHWPAFRKWPNVTYLKEVHGQDVFTVEFRKHFQASFPVRKNMKLSLFLEEYEKKSIYLDSLFSKDSKMVSDIYLPLPLLSITHRAAVDNLNLFISSGNTSSAFHQDGYENLLTVFSGYKDVILYDNKYTRHFDADNYSVAAGVSDMNPENLTINDVKKLQEIPYYTVRIEPGDMLYIPQYWWHQVRSFNHPNIALGIWFDIFDFQKEYEKRNILDVENIVQKTEIFMELVGKEPVEIPFQNISHYSIANFLPNSKRTRRNVSVCAN